MSAKARCCKLQPGQCARADFAGDLNITPAPLDSCDPGPHAEFAARPDRMWLARLLRGPFRDVFRVFHPDRHGASALLKPCRFARLAAAAAAITSTGTLASARPALHMQHGLDLRVLEQWVLATATSGLGVPCHAGPQCIYTF